MSTVVTLLTKEDCDLCEQAKAALARVQDDFAIEVRVVDVATQEGREQATTSGLAFPPGVLIDGRPFSYGRLSERRLRRELNRVSTMR